MQFNTFTCLSNENMHIFIITVHLFLEKVDSQEMHILYNGITNDNKWVLQEI